MFFGKMKTELSLGGILSSSIEIYKNKKKIKISKGTVINKTLLDLLLLNNIEHIKCAKLDDDEIDEASGAAAVAGFTLPLGMSNRGPDQPPSWASYMHAINGSPVQVVGKDTLKVKPMKKPRKRSRKS